MPLDNHRIRMAPGSQDDRATSWPACVHIGGTCIAYGASTAMGGDLFARLVMFVANADPGARLTLQRNQSGFTIQVTGSVRRGRTNQLSLKELSVLSEQFDAPEAPNIGL